MPFTQGHALVIGVGTYTHADRLNVKLTEEDAAQVAATLQDEQFCAYPAEQVALVRGPDATRERILQELDKFAQVKPEDTVTIFYSGHGERGEDGKYYLTTADTEIVNAKVKTGTGVSDQELLAKVKAIPAQRVLLLFNACYSGSLSPGDLSGDGDAAVGSLGLPEETANALLGTGSGRVIVTASGSEQKSYFDWGEPTTLFARVLTQGLRGEGFEGRRGYISVFDLYAHLYDTVSSEAMNRWTKTQQPELTIQQGKGVMAVALHKGKTGEGDLGLGDRPTELPGNAREVDEETSKAAFQQIMEGSGVQVRDMSGGAILQDNQIDLRDSQGANIGTSGDINQTFDNRRTVSNPGVFAEGDAHVDSHDAFTFSGNFQGAILNVRSTLQGVQQSINALPATNQQAKDDLKSLVDHLQTLLGRVGPQQADVAKKIGERVKNLVALVGESQPDQELVEFNLTSLQSNATQLGATIPQVPQVAAQIATQIRALLPSS